MNPGARQVSASPKRNEKLKVILDSNALFVPLEFKLDIFAEAEQLLNRNIDFILLSTVKRELELLARKDSPKIRRQAIYALKVAEKCKYVAVEEDEKLSTDDAIINVAKAWNAPVFTNDWQLRRKLRDISVPVIYVRQKSRLEIDGLI
jgi:rRNA-processing protein FCF1